MKINFLFGKLKYRYISTDLFFDKQIIKEVPSRYFTEQDSFRLKFTSKDNNQVLGLGGKKIIPLFFKKFNYNPWFINHSRYVGHTATPGVDDIIFEYIPTGDLDKRHIVSEKQKDKLSSSGQINYLDEKVNKLSDDDYNKYLVAELDDEFKHTIDNIDGDNDEELLEILRTEDKKGGGKLLDMSKIGKDSIKRGIIGEGVIFTKVSPEKSEGIIIF